MSRKYRESFETITEIVSEYEKGGVTLKELSLKYSINVNTIYNWITKFKNDVSSIIPKSSNNSYKPEFKLKVIKEYLAGNTSYNILARKYNIKNASIIYSWVMKYNNPNKVKTTKRMKFMTYSRKTTIEEREAIVLECIENNNNYNEIAEKYRVNYQQVRSWVKKYLELGKAGLEDRRGKRKGSMSPRTEEENKDLIIAQQNAKIRELEMETALLKKLKELAK